MDQNSVRTAWVSSAWEKYCTIRDKKNPKRLTLPVHPTLLDSFFSTRIQTIRNRSLELATDRVVLYSSDNGLHVFEFVSFSNFPFNLLDVTNSSWADKITLNISQKNCEHWVLWYRKRCSDRMSSCKKSSTRPFPYLVSVARVTYLKNITFCPVFVLLSSWCAYIPSLREKKKLDVDSTHRLEISRSVTKKRTQKRTIRKARSIWAST